MFFFLSNISLCWVMIMPKLDEIRARLDWLKEQFKILVTILVADVAGVSKLYIDTQVDLLFYSGLVLLVVLTASIIIVSRKIEIHLIELRGPLLIQI